MAEMKALHEKVDNLTNIVMKNHLDVKNIEEKNKSYQEKVKDPLENGDEEHMTQHENIDNYNCEKCGKMFVLKWRLRKHMEIHGNGK